MILGQAKKLYTESLLQLLPLYLLVFILNVCFGFFFKSSLDAQKAHIASSFTTTFLSFFVAAVVILYHRENRVDHLLSMIQKQKMSILEYYFISIKFLILFVAGFALLFVPAFYVLFFLYYAPFICLLDKNEMNHFKRSKEFVKSNWKLQIVLTIIYLVYCFMMEVWPSGLRFQSQLVNSAFLFVDAFIQPFIMTYIFVLLSKKLKPTEIVRKDCLESDALLES